MTNDKDCAVAVPVAKDQVNVLFEANAFTNETKAIKFGLNVTNLTNRLTTYTS